MTPLEAYYWLYDTFRAYMRNEVIWTHIRDAFVQAEALKVSFEEKDDLDRFVAALKPVNWREKLPK
jgi:hypothetical protein